MVLDLTRKTQLLLHPRKSVLTTMKAEHQAVLVFPSPLSSSSCVPNRASFNIKTTPKYDFCKFVKIPASPWTAISQLSRDHFIYNQRRSAFFLRQHRPAPSYTESVRNSAQNVVNRIAPCIQRTCRLVWQGSDTVQKWFLWNHTMTFRDLWSRKGLCDWAGTIFARWELISTTERALGKKTPAFVIAELYECRRTKPQCSASSSSSSL